MATFYDNLSAQRDNLVAAIGTTTTAFANTVAELTALTTASPQPSYTLDGESVDFNGYHNALTARLNLLNGQLLAEEKALRTVNEILSAQPFEILTRATI